jgi:flagellar capping protein FliD
METNILIALLLGAIGYFLKQLHADFKRLSNAIIELTTRLAIQEEKGRSGYNQLSKEVEKLEKRVEKIENQEV